jgi:hypothetical protein
VIWARVRFGHGQGWKIRPAVIVRCGNGDQVLAIALVSSRRAGNHEVDWRHAGLRGPSSLNERGVVWVDRVDVRSVGGDVTDEDLAAAELISSRSPSRAADSIPSQEAA